MKKIIFALLLTLGFAAKAQTDSTAVSPTVLIVPYNRMMHLSDADIDIATGSEMEIPQMREEFRKELIRSLNKKFASVQDMNETHREFVKSEEPGSDAIYHSLLY